MGTLARAPLAGGAPREVLENVQWADWSPDGTNLAVVRDFGGMNRLEYPIGKRSVPNRRMDRPSPHFSQGRPHRVRRSSPARRRQWRLGHCGYVGQGRQCSPKRCSPFKAWRGRPMARRFGLRPASLARTARCTRLRWMASCALLRDCLAHSCCLTSPKMARCCWCAPAGAAS